MFLAEISIAPVTERCVAVISLIPDVCDVQMFAIVGGSGALFLNRLAAVRLFGRKFISAYVGDELDRNLRLASQGPILRNGLKLLNVGGLSHSKLRS